MAFKIKIRTGPLAGQEYSLFPNCVLGRSQSDITINDSKISGQHVKFETDPAGKMVAVDLGSRNGITVGRQKVTRVELSDGLEFRVGRTDFQVHETEETESKIQSSNLSLANETISPADILLSISSPPEWFDHLAAKARELHKSAGAFDHLIYPFKPFVELHIAQGIQAGTRWILGYGPRCIGPGSLDLQLFEHNLPNLVVQLEQIESHFVLTSLHPDFVRLNGRLISSDKLNDGDMISFGQTVIKVSFKE